MGIAVLGMRAEDLLKHLRGFADVALAEPDDRGFNLQRRVVRRKLHGFIEKCGGGGELLLGNGKIS